MREDRAGHHESAGHEVPIAIMWMGLAKYGSEQVYGRVTLGEGGERRVRLDVQPRRRRNRLRAGDLCEVHQQWRGAVEQSRLDAPVM